MTRFLLAALLAAPLFTGCQPADSADTPAVAAEAPVDLAADRAAVEAITAAYQVASRAGDHAAISALYADDATIYPANKPAAQGRDALDAYFAANAEPDDITFTTVDVGVSDDGRMAYEVGTTAESGGPGKYLTVYRKTGDGWQIIADSWSEDAPPTATN